MSGLASYTKGKAEQRVVANLYRLAGLWVYEIGRPGLAAGKRGHRGTMQTPGIPDLLVLGPRICFWHEVKAGSARLSQAQRTFGLRWSACGLAPVVVGDREAARQQCQRLGLMSKEGLLRPLRPEDGTP